MDAVQHFLGLQPLVLINRTDTTRLTATRQRRLYHGSNTAVEFDDSQQACQSHLTRVVS